MNVQQKRIVTCLLAALISLPAINAAEPSDAAFVQRRDETLAKIQKDPWPNPVKDEDFAAHMALLLFFKNENVAEANKLVLKYCGTNRLTLYQGKMIPKNRNEAVLRIYLTERVNELLTKEAREAIEDFAWDLLTKYSLGISRATADKADLAHFLLPNNGMTDRWRRYYLSLLIVRQSERYGPTAMLEGDTIANHCRAWDAFWIKFFHIFPNEGADMDIAHPGPYGEATEGVFYDLFDLAANPELRRLAGNFLTLFWAQVAAEFDSKTGERAGMATTRWSHYDGSRPFWAGTLLYVYQWKASDDGNTYLGKVPFLISGYRPPAIVTATARDENRGCYLATSRRPGMIAGTSIKETKTTYFGNLQGPRIVVDKNGNSHFRRDVYYTPDYALGTLVTDPTCSYISDVTLTPMMGATFSSSRLDRIVVMGNGYYPTRATNGITGKAVSIIARDPNAKLGHGERFTSDGTRIFISKGDLWNNRVEDASGWIFTRAGDSYAAIRAAGGGVIVSDKYFTQVNKPSEAIKIEEKVEQAGSFLDLNDMWAPVVIQMGRAADYKSFEEFCAAVKANRFDYNKGKLTYVSNAKETFEYWAKGTPPPRINGIEVNLNPPKTFDSPFLSMLHGSSKAVITYPGQKDLVLDFK